MRNEYGTQQKAKGRPEFKALKEHLSTFDVLPLRTLCALCEWEYLGTALEGRQMALEHRTALHPDRKNSRRPQRNLRSFYQSRLSDDHTAEIMAERDKRARLIGIDL